MKQHYLKINLLSVLLLTSFMSFGQDCTTTITDSNGTTPICSGDTSTLTAASDGDEVYWYNAATNGSLLFTGSPFQTSALSQSTSFWVESRKQIIEDPISGGAKPTRSGTSGSSVVTTTSPWGLVFNATQDFILNSVDVFITSTSAGSLVLNLKDSNLNVLEAVTVATPPGGTGANIVQFTVPLDLTIPAGNGYRLVAVSSPAMVRDFSSDNSFPYPIGNVGSVTQGTINNSLTSNPGVYYFFYNWNFSPIATCTSIREEVAITVIAPQTPTGDAIQLFTLGETVADLDVTGTNLTWYADAAATIEIPESTVLIEGGTYYVAEAEGSCLSNLLAITTTMDLMGVSDIAFSSLKYYPNPVTSKLLISSSEAITQIEIYNLLGQKIHSSTSDFISADVDFSAYSRGTYLLKLFAGTASKTIKIHKE